MTSSLNYSLPSGPETKHQKMKQVVNAIEEYFRTKAEDTALTITKHLQGISVMIDLSIFDPHINDTAQFYLRLHELMNKMEQQSPFAWYCVDVLSNACRNPAARQVLIHTYQFIPSLSRLLGDQLTLERKLRLLKLMQDLSCGMEISWQIPHLPHLMKTLAKWVESEHSEIIALSLGVLVNLCYKNLPAVYTLLGNVDVKQLLRVCTTLEGPAVEVHTCKLLIILNYTDGDQNILSKLIERSFVSIVQAFELRDLVLMRQVVEFFVDASKENNSLNHVITGNYYEEQLLHLFGILENNNDGMEMDEVADGKEPECIALVFKFLHTLIKIKLPTIVQNYELLIDIALKWIHTELASAQALSILTEIAQNVEPSENSILEPLAKALPLFLNELKFERDEEMPIHVEHNKKIANLLRLLRALVRVENVRPKIVEDLQPDTVCKLFGPLLGDVNSPGDQVSVSGTGTAEAVNLYLQAIVLINELAEHDHRWTIVQKQVLEIKHIHMILVKALFEGPKETKTLVMSMFKLPVFPLEMVSDMMVRLQPSTIVADSKTTFTSEGLGGPVLSPAQVQRLDNVLETFKTAIADKNVVSIPTSNVMELYEYKLAAVGHAEATAVASIEAVSERCTHLQHRLNQLTAEINRYHQLLLHSQHCQDQNSQVTERLKSDNRDLLNKIQAAKGKYKACHSQLTASETALTGCRAELEETTRKFHEISDYKKQLEEQYNNLKQCVTKLEENATRLEKTVQRKDEGLNKANQNIEQLHLKLKEWDAAMTRKEAELQKVMKESQARKEILDTITKVANSQRT